MPPGFERIVLKHLLALPAGEENSFIDFADQVIEEAKLTLQVENPDYAKTALRTIKSQSVIDVLSDFGILRREYGPPKYSYLKLRELIAFQVTPFGERLLKALRDANWQNRA
jgi:hypothetical protein